jgi:hypothetical protein
VARQRQQRPPFQDLAMAGLLTHLWRRPSVVAPHLDNFAAIGLNRPSSQITDDNSAAFDNDGSPPQSGEKTKITARPLLIVLRTAFPT